MDLTADDLRQRADRLRSERRAFVTATVVSAERPTSAKAGDTAIVLGDGTVIGFVGGECAHTSVQVQALAALEGGDPVLLRIDPGVAASGELPRQPEAGRVTVHNPCLSGGVLEIFLEPSVPPSLVTVHGEAPIARAVRELASWLGFDVAGLTDGVPPRTDAVVVASHGGSEREVIEAALRAGVPYIGLVASRRRGNAVVDALGMASDERSRVHTPAGLDLGSRTPEEVALSVLAEIVSLRRRRASRQPVEAGGGPTATDPVCGMSVAAVGSSRRIEHDGTTYWFCGPVCEDAFRADPPSFRAGGDGRSVPR